MDAFHDISWFRVLAILAGGLIAWIAMLAIARRVVRSLTAGDADGASGKRAVTLARALRRQHDGTVHFVPNGKMDTVTNRSRGPPQAFGRSAGSG